MRPSLLVFDVNETLSDMAPMRERFTSVGAPGELVAPWFAGLLRDGFALTTAGGNPSFAEVAQESLRLHLTGVVDDPVAAVEVIMEGFRGLPVHGDVVEGIGKLRDLGITLVTLSNGASSIAEQLFSRHGITEAFDRLLSVEDAPLWKPAPSAYHYALEEMGVSAADAMLVAVHPWDIHGAHAAGLATAWLNRRGVDYPAYFSQPTLSAASLPELARQLHG